MEVKTGLEWLNMLTDVEKKQYLENVKNHISNPERFEEVMKKRYEQKYEALTFMLSSFIFEKSPQGFDYWYAVCMKLKNS